MSLEAWKQLCRKTWENEYEYLKIDRFGKIAQGRYTVRNCKKKLRIQSVLRRQILFD